MSETLRQLRAALAGLWRGDWFCDWADRYLLRAHGPEDFGVGVALCTAHRGKPQPWPCAEFTAAEGRITARHLESEPDR